MIAIDCNRSTTRFAWLMVVLCALAAPLPAFSAPADSLLHRYVDAVLSGDWSTAESLWLPEEVTRSRALGIEFDGIPAKFDCASPLVQFRDAIRSRIARVDVIDSVDTIGLPVAEVAVSTPGATARTTYALVKDAGEWKLASPVFAYTQGWFTRDTRFARVHFRDSSRVNDYALSQLDRFVDSVLKVLRVPDERVRQLEAAKIEYYLGDDKDVRRLTGFDTEGMAYLPLDAVVSQYLPHNHDVVHVLVNFALARLPLYTVPWLQEGLAVSLGGRWGKSPAVLMQLGAFVVGSGMASPEDVLTYQGFHDGAGTADVSYALSGLLVRSLLDTVGAGRLLVLYRGLSGSNSQVQSFTPQEVQQRIDSIVGLSWGSVVHLCTSELERFRYSGLRPVENLPGQAPFFHAETQGMAGRISPADSFYVFDVRADSEPVAGAFLFREGDRNSLGGYQSRLFGRQFAGRPYSGEALGIVFDEQEVGLYDYRTDQLLAKFAAGFSSGETIWDAKERVIRFRLLRSSCPLNLAECSCVLIRSSGNASRPDR